MLDRTIRFNSLSFLVVGSTGDGLCVQHLVLALKLLVAYAIPDIPRKVAEERARLEFLRREALKVLAVYIGNLAALKFLFNKMFNIYSFLCTVNEPKHVFFSFVMR